MNGISASEMDALQKQLDDQLEALKGFGSIANATINLQSGHSTLKTHAASTMSTSHTKSQEFFDYPRYRDTQGSLVYGVRLENTQPGHNKEYTVTVTAKPLAGASTTSGAFEYIVEGAWGPIGNTQQKQTKDIDGRRSTSNRTRAIEAAKDLERAKRAKGYVELLKFEEDELISEEDVADNLDWTLTDDMIVDPSVGSSEGIREEIDRNCFCYQAAEELSFFAYSDPTPAGLEIAPALMGTGFGFVRFDDNKRGPRWIVTVLSSCNPYPEPHARAIPVGEAMDDPKLGDRRRSTPQFVEDLVVDALDNKARKDGALDLTILVEEKGIDLIIIDAFRWDGEDLTDTPWMNRRNTMEATFRNVFSGDRKAGRHVEIAPRVISRLRETYLGEGDKYRFELYQVDAPPGGETWLMPRL